MSDEPWKIFNYHLVSNIRRRASYNRDSFLKFVCEKVKTQGASYIGGFGDRNVKYESFFYSER